MKLCIVEQKTRMVLLEFPKDFTIPQNNNLLHFKDEANSKINTYQVINTDFYYERQMIEIRVIKI